MLFFEKRTNQYLPLLKDPKEISEKVFSSSVIGLVPEPDALNLFTLFEVRDDLKYHFRDFFRDLPKKH